MHWSWSISNNNNVYRMWCLVHSRFYIMKNKSNKKSNWKFSRKSWNVIKEIKFIVIRQHSNRYIRQYSECFLGKINYLLLGAKTLSKPRPILHKRYDMIVNSHCWSYHHVGPRSFIGIAVHNIWSNQWNHGAEIIGVGVALTRLALGPGEPVCI